MAARYVSQQGCILDHPINRTPAGYMYSTSLSPKRISADLHQSPDLIWQNNRIMQPAFDTELSVAGLHLSWATKLALIVAWSFLSAAWLRYCCSSRTGWLQLAATLPLFAANAAAPLLFSTGLAGSSLEGDLVEVAGGEPVSRAFTAFLLTWLANFKAVAAAVNRGEHWGCTAPWRRFCSAVAAAAAAATVALPLSLSLPLHASQGASQAPLPNRTMLLLLLPPFSPAAPNLCMWRRLGCPAGPLAQQPWTVMQYWALYCLPLVPSAGPTRRKLRRAHHDSPGSSAELLLRCACTVPYCCAALLHIAHCWQGKALLEADTLLSADNLCWD